MTVAITGGSGYMGRALIPELARRGHTVRALVRNGSQGKLAASAEAVVGNPLEAPSVREAIGDAECLVHLVGVPHPSPAKAQQFREVDLASIQATVAAAVVARREARLRHLVYVSVAHPAPVMKAYIEVRSQGEALIQEAGLNATILRPWYVLRPGHWWPAALIPAYWLMERLPATRESAQRLGLVTLRQMAAALANAVDAPAECIRIVEPPQIRASLAQ